VHEQLQDLAKITTWSTHPVAQGVNTFLLVLAAIFPVVNPPGTALVFLALTQGAAAS